MDEKMQKESMQERMSRFLSGRGYCEVNLHSEDQSLFYLANGTAVSLVWLIGDTALSAMTRETYLSHYEKIRSDFQAHHFDPVHSITLFFTSDTAKTKELGEGTPFWITDESYGRLIVYENQPEDYDGLRRVLERNLHFGADVRNEYGKQKEGISAGIQHAPAKVQRSSAAALIDRGTPIITAILVGLNLIIFLWQGKNDSLIPKGAVSWTDIFYNHQYYRLVTGMFLHGSTEHILNNMLALFLIGMELEKQIGHRRFLFTYFLTGIAASAASCVYNMLGDSPAYSIGASGAVYGIMGTTLVLMLINRDRGDNSMFVRLGIFALYMFYTVIRSDGAIDHAAHIGGFVAGSIIGALLCVINSRKAKKRLLKFRKDRN